MNNGIEVRIERWVKGSIGLARFEPYLVSLVQDIGQLDTNLCARRDPEQQNALHDFEFIQSHRTQSYLWGLGAYEILRTLSQRIREGQSDDPSEVAERIKYARDRFARVRVPLAKFEAGRHKATDNHIAYPGVDLTYGIAWEVNEN